MEAAAAIKFKARVMTGKSLGIIPDAMVTLEPVIQALHITCITRVLVRRLT